MKKKALIERLNADNWCVGCPVFNQCTNMKVAKKR